jgi:hypothetical protein
VPLGTPRELLRGLAVVRVAYGKPRSQAQHGHIHCEPRATPIRAFARGITASGEPTLNRQNVLFVGSSLHQSSDPAALSISALASPMRPLSASVRGRALAMRAPIARPIPPTRSNQTNRRFAGQWDKIILAISNKINQNSRYELMPSGSMETREPPIASSGAPHAFWRRDRYRPSAAFRGASLVSHGAPRVLVRSSQRFSLPETYCSPPIYSSI